MIAERWLKIYMDDLGIHTQGDLALHHERTWWILLCLREHGLSLKLSKCTFDILRIEFLGMIIGQGKIELDSIKLSTIKEWKPPVSIKGIWLFLRFANFYRKFIPNFSHVVAPLNLLTRKDQLWAWTSLQQHTFDTLKAAFSSGPILSILDVTRPFSIMTDTSLFTAGAILLQADTNGNLHPCAYFSQTFLPAEHNYDIYDWELLAVILAQIKKLKLISRSFVPITLTSGLNSSPLPNSNTTLFPIARQRSLPSLFSSDMTLACILHLGKCFSQLLKAASLP